MIDEHRYVGAREKLESSLEHTPLEDRVAGLAQRATEGELAVQKTGSFGVLCLFSHQRDADGGDTSRFDRMCERTHGARAERSDGGEQHHVNFVVEQLLGHCRAGVLENLREIELGAHEREVPVVH